MSMILYFNPFGIHTSSFGGSTLHRFLIELEKALFEAFQKISETLSIFYTNCSCKSPSHFATLSIDLTMLNILYSTNYNFLTQLFSIFTRNSLGKFLRSTSEIS